MNIAVSEVRRLIQMLALVAATAALLPASAAAQAPDEMSWSVLSRFGGDANGDGRLDRVEPGVSEELDVFTAIVRPSAAVCDRGAHPKWSVDGEPANPVRPPSLEEAGQCQAAFELRGERRHTIEVDTAAGIERATVLIDDRLVVALGDSVASGEGNPDADGDWLDEPCHRSSAAGFEQASRLLAEGLAARDPLAAGAAPGPGSITFVSLACSGAEVQEGLLHPYAGVKPQPGTSYSPQVERLRALADARGGSDERGPAIDAILVSIGANDVHFSQVVKACAFVGDCRRRFDTEVFGRLDQLSRSYNELGAALDDAAPGAPVLVGEYFDPTRDEEGEFCAGSVGVTTRAEVRWAYEALLRPLNAELAAAARRNHWQVVDGIAADFERHGYCAGPVGRWVRRLGESILDQGDLVGTLHPNERGHAAIGERVARELNSVLGLEVEVQGRSAEADGGGLPTLAWVAIVGLGVPLAVAAIAYLVWLLSGWPRRRWPLLLVFWLATLLLLPILALIWLLSRPLVLLRPTYRLDPARAQPARPALPVVRRSPWVALIALVAAVVLGVLAILFAGVVGSVILWVRFWSVNLPADQAVNAIGRDELITTGTEALALFAVIGLVAVLVAWLLDGNGQWVRSTRRGLVAIAIVELAAAVLIGDYARAQTLQLLAGLVLAALLVHFLIERALELNWTSVANRPLLADVLGRFRPLLGQTDGSEPRFEWRLVPMRLLPLVALGVAIYRSFDVDSLDRWIWIAGPVLLAAALFTVPGGIAGSAAARVPGASPKLLDPPRIALATTTLVCVLVLLVRDAWWLAGTAVAATVLGLTCLAIAAASKDRFAPYGLAVLVAVPLFGAAAAILRGLDAPEVQPVAVTLEDGTPVCGIYVGESDERLWMARIELHELGHVRRPQPRRGRIFPVSSEEIAELSIGPLQPATRAEDQAVTLRDELLDARDDTDPEARAPTCEPEGPVVELEQTWQRELAERFQPELIVDREDGFWPIPVRTLFSMQDRRATACRQVTGDEDDCVRLTSQGEFPWSGGEGESIEYPADDRRRGEQHDLMVDALGSIDPVRSAREYFLVSGEKRGNRPVTLQYWFFYSFNYQPVPVTGFGFHEGDFESVGILLSAKRLEPRYVWMARHDEEDRVFPWGDDALSAFGDHLKVFAARGSHATYENCARQARPEAPFGLIDDRPACDDEAQLHLPPEATPMTDLSHTAWACWRGLFGHRQGARTYESVPHLVNDAPRSPLWQQEFDDVTFEPCRGVEDPGGREGLGEEVVEESTGTPAMLRAGAGRLELLVDECSDWESPPAAGTFMVACDQDALREYVAGGLEDPGPAGVRIDVADLDRPKVGEITLPAVRRNPTGVYLDEWRITAANPTRVAVFASCPRGDDRLIAARFPSVPIDPSSPVQLSDRDPEVWRLRRDDGTTVATAKPYVVHGGAPAQDERLGCGG